MKYYAIYNEQTKELSKAQVKCLNAECVNIEVSKEVYDNLEKYIYQDGGLIVNPNYEAEQEAKEQERIASLTVTKRVFALALQEIGVTYSQLKAVIAQNEQAQLEWDLCVELERGNPLLDVMASYMNISPKMLDYIFQKANGEDVEMQTELLSQ